MFYLFYKLRQNLSIIYLDNDFNNHFMKQKLNNLDVHLCYLIGFFFFFDILQTFLGADFKSISYLKCRRKKLKKIVLRL